MHLRVGLRGAVLDYEVAPAHAHEKDRARSEALLSWRRRIETAFSQPVDGFDVRRVKVRDLWHLEHRIVRKILALTAAATLNVAGGRSPLTNWRPWSLKNSHTGKDLD